VLDCNRDGIEAHYYTLHTYTGDKVSGMLSVNGYTGKVWYHSWHGAFVDMKELEQ
jgi:hypothetical protein